jgi:rifampicin phosphotransferase
MLVRTSCVSAPRHGAGLVVTLVVAWPTSAYAIPSPELVVSSLSGLSQLWGLIALMMGGGALAVGASTSTRASLLWRRGALVSSAVAVGLFALNVWQLDRATAERTARLEATLTRPSPKSADGAALDPSLREVPYRAQLTSDQGMATHDVAILLNDMASGTRRDVIALDIREAAENEMGAMPQSRPVRFPDIASSGIDFTGKSALLFCHNGNRSAETCAALKARGIACKFMIGGYEKWIVEGHVLTGSNARTLSDIRALPTYPNQKRLLDTAEVHALLAPGATKPVIVDVRYPGEFGGGHLPGAISLPIRPTPTAQLEQRLVDLPPGPILAPCYDRRSCFFAELLGLELTRRGRTFLGRYTVPWEYFIAAPPPPHVEAWLLDANRSQWSRAVASLAALLASLATILGPLGAIAALALVSRLLIAPFAWKGDRDQKILRALDAETAALKLALANDPQRLGRALRDQIATHGLTPGRNALALLFLPVMAVSIEAVSLMAKTQAVPVEGVWLGDLANPDPLYVFPIVFAGAIALYLHLALARTRSHRLIIWLIGAPVLVVLVAALPSAAALYMCMSASLLLLQRWISSWQLAWVRATWRRVALGWVRASLGRSGLVSLRDTQRLATAGNKALRLAILSDSGFPVPRGIVLTSEFLVRFGQFDEPLQRRHLNRIWRHLGRRPLAVRSSASAEDGADYSYAGVFQSVLDVDRANLAQGITTVMASFTAASVGAYAGPAGEANIVIMPMVRAVHAGVVFTRDPAVPGCLLVEWVEGTGEALVSGSVAPQMARLGRMTGMVIDDHAAPSPAFDLVELGALARRIETHFGRPQDIEWAHDGGGFVILQSRDIVTARADVTTLVRDEWLRLAMLAERHTDAGRQVPDALVLVTDDMGELLPRPTPASLSLLELVSGSGGSLDLAARSLGGSMAFTGAERVTAPNQYVCAFGSLMVDDRVRAGRALSISGLSARRLRTGAADLEADTRNGRLPAIVERARVFATTDLGLLTTAELHACFARLRDQFLFDTRVTVDRVNIAAQFYLDDARGQLQAGGYDPAVHLAAHAPSGLLSTLRDLSQGAGDDQARAMVAALGHRAVMDYELAEPRYGEEPARLAEASHVLLQTQSWAHQVAPTLGHSPAVQSTVERAIQFQLLKEDAKHDGLRDLAALRRVLLALDERFGFGGRIFFLTLSEIATLTGGNRREFEMLAVHRQQHHVTFADVPTIPTRLTVRDIECGPLSVARNGTVASLMTGQWVSGAGPVTGRVVCPQRVSSPGGPTDVSIPGFRPGDIIAARAFHPAWMPYLMTCGGVIVEIGGWLSHIAILARERAIPMCVGVHGLDQLQTDMHVRIDANGGVVIVPQHSQPITLVQGAYDGPRDEREDCGHVGHVPTQGRLGESDRHII